jgi:hypothetical protein
VQHLRGVVEPGHVGGSDLAIADLSGLLGDAVLDVAVVTQHVANAFGREHRNHRDASHLRPIWIRVTVPPASRSTSCPASRLRIARSN